MQASVDGSVAIRQAAEARAVERLERSPWSWTVSVHICEAKDLLAADPSLFKASSSDPYAKVRIGSGGKYSEWKRTATKMRTLNPDWQSDPASKMRFVEKSGHSDIDILRDVVEIQVCTRPS